MAPIYWGSVDELSGPRITSSKPSSLRSYSSCSASHGVVDKRWEGFLVRLRMTVIRQPGRHGYDGHIEMFLKLKLMEQTISWNKAI